MQFDVRDTRNKNWLWMRRELLREHGDELGMRGVAVYAALASFTDSSNTAYPSLNTIAEMLDISRPTVRKAIQDLHRLGWIGYEERTKEDGADTSHMFYLLEAPVENNLGGGGNSVSTGSQADFHHEVERNEVEHKKSAGAGENDLPPHAPSEQQVIEYGTSRTGLSEKECRKFFNHYAAVDFYDSNGRELKWKYKLANWDLNQSKFSGGDGSPRKSTNDKQGQSVQESRASKHDRL